MWWIRSRPPFELQLTPLGLQLTPLGLPPPPLEVRRRRRPHLQRRWRQQQKLNPGPGNAENALSGWSEEER
eukprot:gene8293-biopygen907